MRQEPHNQTPKAGAKHVRGATILTRRADKGGAARSFRLLRFVLPLVVGTAWPAGRCNADGTYNREALNETRRIAIVAPFFCTVSPQEPAPATNSAGKGQARVVFPEKPKQTGARKASKSSAPKIAPAPIQPAPIQFDRVPNAPRAKATVSEADKSFHTQALKSLAVTMQTALPPSLAQSGRYLLVPEEATQQALRSLHWRPNDLFERRGMPGDRKFPAPDVNRIQQLARRLHVDAVFVASMRDPASIGDGLRLPFELWQANPFDLGVRRTRAHVLSPRVQAFLITVRGVTAWQDEQMADHPRANPHTPKTLLIDWQEATEQVAQQLADSLLREQIKGNREQ